MEDILVLEKTKIFKDFVLSQSGGKLLIPEPSRINPVMENIRTEGKRLSLKNRDGLFHIYNLSLKPISD
jgi:hypothetical protein